MKSLHVLMYHRVCSDNEAIASRYVVTRGTFKRHMEFLSRQGFYTPRIADLMSAAGVQTVKGKHPIMITFDDGYLDNYENALPVLQEYGFSAIIFVVPDFSRRTNWWDPPHHLGKGELLQPHHIKDMGNSGIEFGAHSFSHRSMPGLSDFELDDELRKGKAALEEIIQQPFSAIAYPYGDVDERVKSAARRAGYSCGFSAHTGPLQYGADLFEIRRIPMTNIHTKMYLRYKVSGVDHFLRWALWYGKKLLGKKDEYHRDNPMHSHAVPQENAL